MLAIETRLRDSGKVRRGCPELYTPLHILSDFLFELGFLSPSLECNSPVCILKARKREAVMQLTQDR